MDMFCACHAQDGQEFMGLFCAPTTRSSRNTLLSASATAAKEGSNAEERLGLKATTGSGSAIHDEIFGKGVEKAETETPLSDAFHKAWGGDASYTAVSRYFLQSETFNLTETVGSLRLLSIPAFGNVNVIDTGAGLVMIDTAINAMAPQIVDIIHKAFPNKVVTHCICECTARAVNSGTDSELTLFFPSLPPLWLNFQPLHIRHARSPRPCLLRRFLKDPGSRVCQCNRQEDVRGGTPQPPPAL